MKSNGALIPLYPRQSLRCRLAWRVLRVAGFGLAGEVRRGSDLREQPGGGVQQVGRGDGSGGLALEQGHQLGQLVRSGGATDQVP